MSPQGKDNGLKVDPSLKCWIGNLPDGTSWKALQEHMNQARQCCGCFEHPNILEQEHIFHKR